MIGRVGVLMVGLSFAAACSVAERVETTESTSRIVEKSIIEQEVRVKFESRVDDIRSDELAFEALKWLNDPRGWSRAGFRFIDDSESDFTIVLAEGPEVDSLCLPLKTGGTVSCQNGPIVALNADKYRNGPSFWTAGIGVYRGYLINHEVGHLFGQVHPAGDRCPVQGEPAAVMEQQTGGLHGCEANPWPRDWEIQYAMKRPVVFAPLPEWAPDPRPENLEGSL